MLNQERTKIKFFLSKDAERVDDILRVEADNALTHEMLSKFKEGYDFSNHNIFQLWLTSSPSTLPIKYDLVVVWDSPEPLPQLHKDCDGFIGLYLSKGSSERLYLWDYMNHDGSVPGIIQQVLDIIDNLFIITP